MKKQITAVLLALITLASFIPATGLAAGDEAAQAAQALYEQGLFKGVGNNADGTPDFALDRTPTRHEAVTMLVRLLGKDAQAQAGTWEMPFTDVADWAKPYVGYAYANGLTTGTSETTYSGDALVDAAQYLTFVLRALGYTSGTDFQWDRPWELSDSIGLTGGNYNAGTAGFTRGDVAVISKSALTIMGAGTDAAPDPDKSESGKNAAANETKVEILTSYQNGLKLYGQALQLVSDGISAVRGNNSTSYVLGYLKTTFQYYQEYVRLAAEDWNAAVELCGDYSDTQTMKGYLMQLVDKSSSLLNYDITVDNVLEYMQYRSSAGASITELGTKIEAEMDLWVKAAIAANN